jgi:secreted protein with Ig-like and vWFA domain
MIMAIGTATTRQRTDFQANPYPLIAKDSMKLTGKHVVITVGTSGFGLDLNRALQAHGAPAAAVTRPETVRQPRHASMSRSWVRS